MRGLNLFEELKHDIRYTSRTLRKSPGFTIVAVLSIGLGIGANTAIFSVCDAVLLKPLPYSNPDRLVMLWEKNRRSGSLGAVSPGNFVDWRTQSRSFLQMCAVNPFPSFTLTGHGEPERLSGAGVSANFFEMLGTRITLGHDFTPDNDKPGHAQVAILSHELWQRRLGSRIDAIGSAIVLNNTSYTVIGVLPVDFQFVSKASDFQGRNQFDVWVPLALNPASLQRGTHPLRVLARLGPHVSFSQAQAELTMIAANLETAFLPSNKNIGAAVVPLSEQVVHASRTSLLTLFSADVLLLMIACVNLATLLMSRAAARRTEMALRLAIGASRRRLCQQLLTESLVLSLIGGVMGLTLCWWAKETLVKFLPANLPRIHEVNLDLRALAFTCAVTLITGVLFGIIPARQAWHLNEIDSLKNTGRSSTPGSDHSRLRSVFVIGETAMAAMLLVGAGLMARSLSRLLDVPLGFRTEHVVTFRLSLPTSRYSTPRAVAATADRIVERLTQLPGAGPAGIASYLPFSGTNNSWSVVIEGRPKPAPGDFIGAQYRPISPGYFETLGIPLASGRRFDNRDSSDGQAVVVINESMARTFWHDENAIGKRMQFEGLPWRTIVGIVRDVRHEGLDTASKPEFYVPFAQVPYPERDFSVAVRTVSEPLAIVPTLRQELANLDPDLPLSHVETMEQLVAASVAQPRFRTLLVSGFAVLALLISALGIYGVISYLVVQRTREFGIRLALGAQPIEILSIVLGQTARLVLAGLSLGLIGSVFLTRFIGSLLYGIGSYDIPTFVGMAALLLMVALFACYLPARYASRINPIVALRFE